MKFSIIIPTYNRATLLPETIKSVQNQTYTKWECIVVDDGSTDNTKEIVESLIQNDNRIKYVYQENAERSAARNNGIRNSSGDYICFLDSDDHYFSDHLEKLNHFINQQNEKICMIVNQMQIVGQDKKEVTTLPPISKNVIEYLYVNPLTPSRVCIHNDILKKMKFDEDIVVVEDRILWMRIADKFPVYISNHIGVNYNIHEDNSVNLHGTGALKTYKGVLVGEKRYPFIFKLISSSVRNDMKSRVETNIAYYYYLNNFRFQALKWLFKSLVTSPFHIQTKMRIYQIISIIIGKQLKLD